MDRYLELKAAGLYCGGRSARWARRHSLPNVPYVDLPGSGDALFKVCDIDAFLGRYAARPCKLTP